MVSELKLVPVVCQIVVNVSHRETIGKSKIKKNSIFFISLFLFV